MDIRAALTRIAAIQAGLSITTPAAMSVKRAYTYPPNRDSALPDPPCWINTWTFNSSPGDGQGQRRVQTYTVQAQLFVEDADLNRAADIATAFHLAWVAAMSADIRLAGAVSTTTLRGGSPTLVALQWANKPYIGLDEFVDISIFETFTFS